MSAPKSVPPTKREETEAYELVDLRDGACVRCGAQGLVSHDHRKNRSQGGQTTSQNIQILCGTGTLGCHGWATTHPEDAVRDGFAVPGWPTADPAAWPARRLVYGVLRWVLYGAGTDFAVIPNATAEAYLESKGVR